MDQHFYALSLDLLRLCIWLVLLTIVFVPLERIFSLRRQKVFRKSFGADLFYYVLNGILPQIVLLFR